MAAAAEFGNALCEVLRQLEPRCLGLYWPVGSEFNAPAAVAADPELARVPLALPYARRKPDAMHYRAWDGTPPLALDECRIGCSEGPEVVPDVVVVPCVGYTDTGFRLGYGSGYFDRWLAVHREVCAVGVAWSATRLSEAEFAAQPHDVPLTLIVTERGVA